MSSYANHMRRSHRSEKTHRTSAASMQRFSSLKGRAAAAPLVANAEKHFFGRRRRAAES